ncbi:MAG TPA: hypothetical protein VF281_00590, partial [Candidatus Saccharimonadales bacterium]
MIIGIILAILVFGTMPSIRDFLTPIMGYENATGLTHLMSLAFPLTIGLVLFVGWCIESLFMYL